MVFEDSTPYRHLCTEGLFDHPLLHQPALHDILKYVFIKYCKHKCKIVVLALLLWKGSRQANSAVAEQIYLIKNKLRFDSWQVFLIDSLHYTNLGNGRQPQEALLCWELLFLNLDGHTNTCQWNHDTELNRSILEKHKAWFHLNIVEKNINKPLSVHWAM